jgi:hypothetical protein
MIGIKLTETLTNRINIIFETADAVSNDEKHVMNTILQQGWIGGKALRTLVAVNKRLDLSPIKQELGHCRLVFPDYEKARSEVSTVTVVKISHVKIMTRCSLQKRY